MDAFKCDRCGKLYEKKNTPVIKDCSIIIRGVNTKKVSVVDYDICDACARGFENWWKEGGNK